MITRISVYVNKLLWAQVPITVTRVLSRQRLLMSITLSCSMTIAIRTLAILHRMSWTSEVYPLKERFRRNTRLVRLAMALLFGIATLLSHRMERILSGRRSNISSKSELQTLKRPLWKINQERLIYEQGLRQRKRWKPKFVLFLIELAK